MNRYNPHIHNRKSIRLKGYDYSQAGLYFVTICVKNRECLFGKINNQKMELNDAGMMVEKCWYDIPNHFPNTKLHEMVVMPNHFHGILEIVGSSSNNGDNGRGNPRGYPNNNNPDNNNPNNNPNIGQPQGIAPTLGDMVGAFESITTVEYIRGVKQNEWQRFDGKLWQRNYWEHIIRDENEYNRIAQYIIDNPIKWENDKLNDGNGNIVMETQLEYANEIWMI